MQATGAQPRPTNMGMVRTPRLAVWAAWLLGPTLVFLLIGLVLAPWQQTIPGEGRVIAQAPLDRQQRVEAPIAGRIVRWYVQEGTQVEAGDKVVELADNDPNLVDRLERQRRAAEDKLAAALQQAASLATRITSIERTSDLKVQAAEFKIEQSAAKVRVSEQKLTAAKALLRADKLNARRRRELARTGLASERDKELAVAKRGKSEADVSAARADIAAAKADLASSKAYRREVEADMAAKIDKARSELRKAESDVAEARDKLASIEVKLARQASQVVVAPRSGTIVRLLTYEGSEMVKSGEPLALLVPHAPEQAVELWVDGNDVPLVDPGRKVRLQFEGWPAVQFVGWPQVAVGTFGGVVSVVDATDDGKGRFRLIIKPDPDDEAWPSPRWLRQGARAKGWVMLEQVRLGYELWRQFNGFPPALSGELGEMVSGGGKQSSDDDDDKEKE